MFDTLSSQPASADTEFALCVACCRTRRDAAASDAVRALAARVDWTRFIKMVQRHRIQGLAHRSLQAAGVGVPLDAGAELARMARQIALQNMAMAAECVALDDAFRAGRIKLLFVKGLTLAQLAYGDIATKQSWDIDILIAPDDLDAAIERLEARDYRLTIPADRARVGEWHRRSKESVWRHRGTGHVVELHTALTDSPFGLVGVDVHSPAQSVDIGAGKRLPTLAKDDLFAYLAAHGASSGWFRLKWIADTAALLVDADASEIARLYAHAETIGAGRAAGLALLLADRLFGLSLAPDLRERIASDRVVGRMVKRALGLMSGRSAVDNVTDIRFGTVPIHRIQFALRPDWRYKTGLLRTKLSVRFF